MTKKTKHFFYIKNYDIVKCGINIFFLFYLLLSLLNFVLVQIKKIEFFIKLPLKKEKQKHFITTHDNVFISRWAASSWVQMQVLFCAWCVINKLSFLLTSQQWSVEKECSETQLLFSRFLYNLKCNHIKYEYWMLHWYAGCYIGCFNYT